MIRLVAGILPTLLVFAYAPLAAQPSVAEGTWAPPFAPSGIAGSVGASVAVGDDIVVGGTFELAGGTLARSIALFDRSDNRWRPMGNGVTGTVHALHFDGTWLWVGGEFDSAGGVAAGNLARWRVADGHWEGVEPGADGPVLTMTGFEGGVVIGGSFTRIQGEPSGPLVIATPQGGYQAAGLSLRGGIGERPTVRALTAGGATLYVGGSFDSVAGMPARNVARLTGGVWNTLGEGNGEGVDDVVHAIVASDEVVYVGGAFQRAGLVETKGTARWTPATGVWRGLVNPTSGLNGTVLALALFDGILRIGGELRPHGGSGAVGLLSWNGGGYIVPDVEITATVRSLLPIGDSLLLGGEFELTTDERVQSVAIMTSDRNWYRPGPPGNAPNGPVYALLRSGADLYVGGEFSAVGSAAARNIARLHLPDRTWHPLAGGTDGPVRALLMLRDRLYAGGSFESADTIVTGPLAYWSPATSTWGSLQERPSGEVRALATDGTRLFVGGSISSPLSGVNVAAVDPGMGGWTGIASTTGGSVLALAVIGSSLYAGGEFTTIADRPVGHIARTRISPVSWEGLGSGTDTTVRALATLDRTLIVGGDFVISGTIATRGIARWDHDGGYWDFVGEGIDGPPHVEALAVVPGYIYAGGTFASVGGVDAANVARFDLARGGWQSLGVGVRGRGEQVSALASTGAGVAVGGSFSRGDATPSLNLALWSDAAAGVRPNERPDRGSFAWWGDGRLHLRLRREYDATTALELHDMLGRSIVRRTLETREGKVSLRIEGIRPGVYIVTLGDERCGIMVGE